MNARWRKLARAGGTAALWGLALIHLVLPLTPANQHPEIRIKISAALIGVVFLALAILARRLHRRATTAGLLFFIVVSATAALTGRSPVEEGLIVKLFFVLALSAAMVAGDHSRRASR